VSVLVIPMTLSDLEGHWSCQKTFWSHYL